MFKKKYNWVGNNKKTFHRLIFCVFMCMSLKIILFNYKKTLELYGKQIRLIIITIVDFSEKTKFIETWKSFIYAFTAIKQRNIWGIYKLSPKILGDIETLKNFLSDKNYFKWFRKLD